LIFIIFVLLSFLPPLRCRFVIAAAADDDTLLPAFFLSHWLPLSLGFRHFSAACRLLLLMSLFHA